MVVLSLYQVRFLPSALSGLKLNHLVHILLLLGTGSTHSCTDKGLLALLKRTDSKNSSSPWNTFAMLDLSSLLWIYLIWQDHRVGWLSHECVLETRPKVLAAISDHYLSDILHTNALPLFILGKLGTDLCRSLTVTHASRESGGPGPGGSWCGWKASHCSSSAISDSWIKGLFSILAFN